jgi:membrane-bound inhibitor of C-type lysozyme
MKHSCRSLLAARLVFTLTLASVALIMPARAQQPDPNPIPPPAQPPASPAAPTTPVQPSTPASGDSPSSHMMRTWRRLNYSCDGGEKVVVNLHAKEARVTFKGKTYNMKLVDDSEGRKFTDGSLVWSEKEEVGTLERSSKSSDAKSLASACHLQSTATNPPPAPKPKATPPTSQP